MPKKTALLLIDIQNDYFAGGLQPLEAMEAAAANAASLLQRFRERGWPRYHVQHVSTRAGATFFLPGSPGVEIHETVCPSGDEPVVIKHHANSFRDTSLFDDLYRDGVGDLVICGAMSHLCVDAATRHAVDFGFQCTVVHDACATRALTFGERTVAAADVHGAHMAALRSYARVCRLEELAPLLEREAVAA